MPFEIHPQDDPPGSFVLVAKAAEGEPAPKQEEESCEQRVRQFFMQVGKLKDDGTPRGAENILARDRCIEQLRARAEELADDKITANDFLPTTFKYEGRLDERLAYIQNASIVISAYRDPDNPENFVDVEYEIRGGVTTEEQLDLKRAIDQAATIVKVVFNSYRDSVVLHEYIRNLVSIGRIGLFEGNIELAKSSLETLQYQIVTREASRVKNHYVKRLGGWSAAFIIVFMGFYLLLRHAAEPGIGWQLWLLPDAGPNPTQPFALYRFRNFLLLAMGASFSAWLTFLIRTPKLEFTRLAQLDDDLLRPLMRVLFTIGLSFVIGLFFWTGLLEITIGRFKTDFASSGMTAILIGVFCGVASRALATAVSRRAEDFAGNVGASDKAPQAT